MSGSDRPLTVLSMLESLLLAFKRGEITCSSLCESPAISTQPTPIYTIGFLAVQTGNSCNDAHAPLIHRNAIINLRQPRQITSIRDRDTSSRAIDEVLNNLPVEEIS